VVVFSVATGPRGEAIELRVEPSRFLYGIDREAYIEVLKTAELALAEAVEAEERAERTEAPHEVVDVPALAVGAAAGPVTDVVPEYAGVLKEFRPGVEAFLLAEDLNPSAESGGGSRLIDSMLATAEQNIGLDWKERIPLQ